MRRPPTDVIHIRRENDRRAYNNSLYLDSLSRLVFVVISCFSVRRCESVMAADIRRSKFARKIRIENLYVRQFLAEMLGTFILVVGSFLPLDEAISSRPVFLVVSGRKADGRTGGNAFGAS